MADANIHQRPRRVLRLLFLIFCTHVHEIEKEEKIANIWVVFETSKQAKRTGAMPHHPKKIGIRGVCGWGGRAPRLCGAVVRPGRLNRWLVSARGRMRVYLSVIVFCLFLLSFSVLCDISSSFFLSTPHSSSPFLAGFRVRVCCCGMACARCEPQKPRMCNYVPGTMYDVT